jgi:hypothetical protein
MNQASDPVSTEKPMSRVVTSLVALLAAGVLSTSALSADWADDGFREGYPDDWEFSNDTLNFDLGIRYWYALGTQEVGVFGDGYTGNDQSQILEAHFRIEDDATSSYVSGMAGYAARIDGSYTNPLVTDAPIAGGTVGYVQGDFGWMPLGDDNFRLGALVGYQYWNDSPDVGRANFLGPTGGDSEPNNVWVNSLRLGVTSKYDFNDMFDVTAELAAVPYGWVNGTYGAYVQPDIVIGPDTYTQGGALSVNGHAWGGQAQVMFGLHPTENI